MSVLGVTSPLEQVQVLRDPLQDLGRGEDAGAGSRKLDGQRQVVQPAGELGSGPDDVLEIVEQQQHLAFTDVLSEAVAGAQGLAHCLADEGGIP